MSTDDLKYWPFEVLGPDALTEEHRKEIRFLETAFAEGFRPCACGPDFRASSDQGREAWIIWRGRRRQGASTQWEVRLFSEDQSFHCFWLEDFSSIADAVLKWLRGLAWADILPDLQTRIVKGPSQHDSEGNLVEKCMAAKP